MKHGMIWMLCACLGLGMFVQLAAGQDLDAIKARMAARLPTVDALKAKKVVGEDNKGYLAFVGAAKDNEADVTAENTDRKAVYTAIAGKTGSTPDAVGKSRAKEIAKNSAKGVMVQDENGKWYAK